MQEQDEIGKSIVIVKMCRLSESQWIIVLIQSFHLTF